MNKFELQVNILSAMSTGLVDKKTGEYTGNNKKLNIMDALKVNMGQYFYNDLIIKHG